MKKRIGSIVLTLLNLIWPGAGLLWRNQIAQAIGYAVAFVVLNTFRHDIGSIWAIYVWLLAQIHFHKVRDSETFRDLTRATKSFIWLSSATALVLYSIMYGPYWTHAGEVKEPMILFLLVLLALGLPTFILTHWLTPRKMMHATSTRAKIVPPLPGGPQPGRAETTTAGFFKSRPVWKELPVGFLNALASKLDSVQAASEFAELCEQTCMLRGDITRIVDLMGDEPEDALGGIAATLTSYANTMGDRKKFDAAKRALRLALTLKPRHMPAWSSMALVSYFTGDCTTAVFWADKVLTFTPNPDSRDLWERAAADSITPEGERFASKALNDPGLLGASNELQQQMKAIKYACR